MRLPFQVVKAMGNNKNINSGNEKGVDIPVHWTMDLEAQKLEYETTNILS